MDFTDYPPRLYKYVRFYDDCDYTERIFLRNELWLSSVADFNDPFDGKFAVSGECEDWQYKDWLMRYFEDTEPHMTYEQQKAKVFTLLDARQASDRDPVLQDMLSATHQLVETILGITCFTAVSDSILMWSHYADSHRGLCLKFDVGILQKTLGMALPVTYQDEYPVVKPFTQSNSERFKRSILTKSRLWTYEKEYRLIVPGRVRESVNFPSEALTSVIFGAKMLPDHRDQIIGWVQRRESEVAYHEAKLKPTDYGVDIVPLDVDHLADSKPGDCASSPEVVGRGPRQ